MALFTLPGTLFGFRRDRSGAQLLKCTREDGAPTLLMQPRPGGPPLYEKDIEVHVSATKEFGLAVTVARSDGGSEHTLGDILSDACDNIDFARQRKWTWWSGGIVRPEAKVPAVKPRGPGKSASPVVIRKPAPTPKPQRSDQTVPVPEAATPPSSSAASSPGPSAQTNELVPPSTPAAAAEMDAARVAGALARRLAPLFAGGFAVVVAVVWAFLHFQHADLLALMSKQQQPQQPPVFMTGNSEITGTVGERRLPLFDQQDRPPCAGASQEKDGGCWVAIEAKPPCPETSFERDGKCWMPASGLKKRAPRSGESH